MVTAVDISIYVAIGTLAGIVISVIVILMNGKP